MPDHQCPGVLVVDDHPDIRALLQTILRHHGFNVWLAPGGPEALQLYRLQRDAVDIVLLDVATRDWNGPRMMKAILRENPQAIVCFVAGGNAEFSETNLVSLGAARVIRKPFEAVDIARVLWELVGAGAGDRRATPRHPKQSTRVSVGPGLAPVHIVESWVSDESNDGLCLKLPEKLGDVGALLSIRLADAADDAPWVAMQVRHCRPDGDAWTVGCQFVHPDARWGSPIAASAAAPTFASRIGSS